MEFNQETVKRIRGLIVFAALVVLCFWRYDIVLDGINFVIHVSIRLFGLDGDCFCIECANEFSEAPLQSGQDQRT